MLLLALDTSTRQASIALSSEDELYGEYTWQVGNNHSVELLQRIQRLFAECGKTMPDIDVVAVATGPGSFNGVRVAVATAKALSFSLQKPIVGVSTLEILAAHHCHWPGPICSVLEAGRTELYAACYMSDKNVGSNGDMTYRIRQLGDYQLLSPRNLSTYLEEQASTWAGIPGERELPPFLFCGEMSVASRQALYAQMQERCFFVNPVAATRHASVLAMLALQRIRDGKEDNPLQLEPLYLRRPSITTSTRKQPLLGGKPDQLTGQSKTERGEGALRH